MLLNLIYRIAGCHNLEEEIIGLRQEIEKLIQQAKTNYKFVKSGENLDEMLQSQRDPKIKIGLGFK